MGTTTQNQWRDSAGQKSLARQTCRAEILDQSRCIGKNRENWEGELAIGNYRELSGIIGTRFLPIFPNNSQSGKIGRDRECRISVSGITIILQIFQPNARFPMFCGLSQSPIPVQMNHLHS
jgi:hypothetical protein